ncbi:hypothetical protein GN157_12830 [Flavobacterium rakeshii]|uniref:Uncharacterized protein n=1 Tax=Flavobacterium rakeshii TaxID=1038845 RepID=A0A6N8HFU1_9FLAO|nr:hypothetical protein [Flavobacterium rakeshii]MUV04594.1 hypothetical protein [Flavobacterium rakeshii]
MKTTFLILFLIPLLSCNPDEIPVKDNTKDTIQSYSLTTNENSVSEEDSYTSIRPVYTAIRKQIDLGQGMSLKTIESVAMQNEQFVNQYLTDYQGITQEELTAIMSLALEDMPSFLSVLGLSTEGESEFTSMITALQEIKAANASRAEVIAYLQGREDLLNTANGFTPEDLSVLKSTMILVSCSLSRDCEDHTDDCDHDDDRDWELSIGHITATAYGSSHSIGNAITSCLFVQ